MRMRRPFATLAALLLAAACKDDPPTVVPPPAPTPTVNPATVVTPLDHADKGIAAGEIRYVAAAPAPGSTLTGCAAGGAGCRLLLNFDVRMLTNWLPNHVHVYGTAGGGCEANARGVEITGAPSFLLAVEVPIRGCTAAATLSRLQVFLYYDQDYDNAVIQDFGVTYTLQP
jgi:hypothetical protein